MKFLNQFYLTSIQWNDLKIPNDFQSREHKEVCLRYSNHLPLNIFSQENGGEIWILGWLFFANKLVTEKDSQLPTVKNISDLINSKIITQSYGRYFIIYFATDQSTYLLGDSAGTLSAFYKSKGYLVASSIELIRFTQYPIFENKTLQEALKECEKQCHYWYAGGLCELSDIYLLFPNHYLKLGDQEPRRFYPTADIHLIRETEKQKLKNKIDTATQVINESVLSFSKVGSLALPITSGRDSRIILSAIYANQLNQKTTCYTVEKGDPNDTLFGSVLALSCDVKWLDKNPSNCSVLLPGYGGEICKGYWYQYLNQTISNQVERIYKAIPFTEYINEELIENKIKQWISNLLQRVSDDYLILDIAYLELRWASTMGQVHYKHDEVFPYSFSSFASRRFIETSLSLPLRMKKRMSLYYYICQRNASHLITVPAGSIYYSYSQIPRLLLLLAFGFFLSSEFQSIIYSRAMKRSIAASVILTWNRLKRKL